MAMMRTSLRRESGANGRSLKPRGFALLVAIIFMSVMLAFGLILGSLAYKQETLASSSVDSGYAFYAADSALECALYADQRDNAFVYNADTGSPIPTYSCAGNAPYATPGRSYAGSGATATQILTYRFLLNGTSCADVTVYKPQSATGRTYIFSQGYSAPCATVAAGSTNARFSSRGVEAHY